MAGGRHVAEQGEGAGRAVVALRGSACSFSALSAARVPLGRKTHGISLAIDLPGSPTATALLTVVSASPCFASRYAPKPLLRAAVDAVLMLQRLHARRARAASTTWARRPRCAATAPARRLRACLSAVRTPRCVARSAAAFRRAARCFCAASLLQPRWRSQCQPNAAAACIRAQRSRARALRGPSGRRTVAPPALAPPREPPACRGPRRASAPRSPHPTPSPDACLARHSCTLPRAAPRTSRSAAVRAAHCAVLAAVGAHPRAGSPCGARRPRRSRSRPAAAQREETRKSSKGVWKGG